jgi:integrase
MQAAISDRLIKSLKPDKVKPYEVRDTKIKGFLLRVQPTGSMSYYCEFKRGKRERLGSVGVVTLGRARKLALDILAEEQGDGYTPKKKRVDDLIETLEDFLDKEYIPWFKAHRKPPYSNLNNLVAFKHLNHRNMTDISIRMMERWSAKQKEDGKADSTIKRYLNTLKAVLNKAVEWGVIEKSPLANLKPIKTDDIGRIRFLSGKEEKALFKALDEREVRIHKKRDSANSWRASRNYELLPDLNKVAYADHLKPIVIMAMNTGLRKGEILSLTWRDVNFQTNQLTVRGEVAKSSKTRHIPLNKTMLAVLRGWHKQSDSEQVFVVGAFQKAWQKLIKDAGLIDFKFHDLRHDFASKLVMAGVDLKTVQELLGHANLTMTLRYSHLASSHKADAVERLAE